jgi:hypothetical protein
MSCYQKNIEENRNKQVEHKSLENTNSSDSISIRAFDRIFFGNINPQLKNDSERYDFLQHYRVEIAGAIFYTHPPNEKIDSDYGLYQFGLTTIDSYDIIDAKKISLELKSIIEKKYSNGKKINISNKSLNEKINKEFIQNINRSLPEGTPPIKDELGIPYDTFEYVWTKNNIQVMLGYWVEYNWVDKNNVILDNSTDIRSRIKGQKKFYRPKLKFTHLGLQKRVWAEDTKREENFEKETKQLENKRRQKDSEKF